METEAKPGRDVSRDVLKRVVKRKKAVLCKTLKVTEETLADLAASGVITPSVFSTIMSLNQGNRMASIVENLVLDDPANREKFLEFVNAQSPWMYEELLTEAKAETKDLEVDDYEIEDASFLIHRHFGSSKRFSEMDKKTITSLVATKSQVAKEVWSRRLSASKTEVEETRKILEERDALVRKTNEVMKSFIRRNERELHDFARAKSTTQILSSTKNKTDGDTLDELIRRTDFLIERFERALLDKQAICEQRDQCMAILKMDDMSVPIHKLVKQTIEKLSRENESGKSQVRALKMKAIELEEKLNERDIQLEKLRSEIETLKQKTTKKLNEIPLRSMNKSPTPNGEKQKETSPKNIVSKPDRIFPMLEQQKKPKYCPRPREPSSKAMPLHGRSYLLNVS